jgi:general nucleoside transport system ATP-binding protein
MTPILELRNITKSFGNVVANDQINLSLEKGEIHALLGENGAGKTTLMNILYGLYYPDAGEILVNGEKVKISIPNDAINAGIGMVHQHFMLVPVFTVTENVIAGEESLKFGFVLNREDPAKKIREISIKYGLEVNPDDLVKDLSVGLQQRVEIIKLLYRNANILIMDEPTAVLTPQETEKFFKVMRSLKKQGKTIIFITHKLKEVMNIADKISVLRRGKLVATTIPDKMTEGKLAELMVGREVILKVNRKPAKPGNIVTEVENLSVLNDRQKLSVDKVSFTIREGEILGIAGVQGNGQTELVETMTGLRNATSGEIRIRGVEVSTATPRTVTELGVSHIPEDRQHNGLVLSSPISINMVLCSYYKPPFSKGIVLQHEIIEQEAEKQIKAFDVRTTGVGAIVGSLSGGNQQKVIIAREFSRDTKFLIASQPTRGVDVGSIEYIHNQIIMKRDSGTAILLVSSELDEILALSDRIAVMYSGEIVGIIDSENATKENVGLMMAGIVEKLPLTIK